MSGDSGIPAISGRKRIGYLTDPYAHLPPTRPVNHSIAHVALVVRDYDEAIRFYVDVLGFELVDDTFQPEQNKRWVLVRPRGHGPSLLLARATTPEQERAIGNQTGGRVFLFLDTDDFQRDYATLSSA